MVQVRSFGRLGWQVSEVGVGMFGMGGAWKGATDRDINAALHAVVDLGGNYFDTSLAYGNGHSEQLYKRISWERPDKKLYVATKIPPKAPPLPGTPLAHCYPPDYIRECTEKSLLNLGALKIDLQQFDGWQDEWAHDESWQRTVDDMKREEIIEGVGVCVNQRQPGNVLATLATGHIDAVQVTYNIWQQAPADALLPTCREHNIAVVARAPLDSGGLAGTLMAESTFAPDDWRSTYFTPDTVRETVARVGALRADLPPGTSLAELALRFVLANDAVSTAVAGMRRPQHVEANLRASNADPLPPALLALLHRHRWDR